MGVFSVFLRFAYNAKLNTTISNWNGSSSMSYKSSFKRDSTEIKFFQKNFSVFQTVSKNNL